MVLFEHPRRRTHHPFQLEAAHACRQGIRGKRGTQVTDAGRLDHFPPAEALCKDLRVEKVTDLEAWELMDGFLRHQTPTDPEVVAAAADLVYAPLVIGEQSSAAGEALGTLVRLGGSRPRSPRRGADHFGRVLRRLGHSLRRQDNRHARRAGGGSNYRGRSRPGASSPDPTGAGAGRSLDRTPIRWTLRLWVTARPRRNDPRRWHHSAVGDALAHLGASLEAQRAEGVPFEAAWRLAIEVVPRSPATAAGIH